MKNLIAILFCGLIVLIANLFTDDTPAVSTVGNDISSGLIEMKENQERILRSEVTCLVEKNSVCVDSLKNRN